MPRKHRSAPPQANGKQRNLDSEMGIKCKVARATEVVRPFKRLEDSDRYFAQDDILAERELRKLQIVCLLLVYQLHVCHKRMAD